MRAPRYEARHFPYVNLARVYQRRGQIVEALAQLSRAADVSPEPQRLNTWIRKLQAKVN